MSYFLGIAFVALTVYIFGLRRRTALCLLVNSAAGGVSAVVVAVVTGDLSALAAFCSGALGIVGSFAQLLE